MSIQRVPGPWLAALAVAASLPALAAAAARPTSTVTSAASQAPAPAADKPSAQASDPRQLAAQARRLTTSGKIDEAVALFNNALGSGSRTLRRAPGPRDRARPAGPVRARARAPQSGPGRCRPRIRAARRSPPWLCRTCSRATRPKPPSITRSSSTSRWRNRPSMAPPAPRTPSAGCSSRPGTSTRRRPGIGRASRPRRKLPGLPQDQVDLWEMRWLHGQSRLAARRGRGRRPSATRRPCRRWSPRAEKTRNRNRSCSISSATTRFHLGDLDRAIAELSRADQADPFILALLAQTYEKKGDRVKAKEYWNKVLGLYGHSLQNALVRDRARAAVGSK